jgi:hypothetical protein
VSLTKYSAAPTKWLKIVGVIVVYSEALSEHINPLQMQNEVFIRIKTRGTCIKHRSLKLEAKAGKWVWVELIHVRV